MRSHHRLLKGPALVAAALVGALLTGFGLTTVSASAAGDSAPIGYLDTCISGWARDPDFAGPIDVHLYVNGAHVASQAANQASEPAVGGTGAHRYSFSLDLLPTPVSGHDVQVFALGRDAAGNGNGNNPALPLGGSAPRALHSDAKAKGAWCSRPAPASEEATFEDYERLLCPVARARGLQVRGLAERQAPLAVHDTFADGANGEWSHVGEPAPCLSMFVDLLAEPYRSNYKKTLQKLHDALNACKDAGFRMDQHHKRKGYNPTFDYRNFNAAFDKGAQGGDLWGACLSKSPWTEPVTLEQIQAGDPTAPGPGSVIDSLIFCKDDPATPWPDYIKDSCKTPFGDRYRISRATEQAAASDTTWLTQGRAMRLAMREALGVSITSSATGSGTSGPVSSGLTPTSQPLTVAALTALVG